MVDVLTRVYLMLPLPVYSNMARLSLMPCISSERFFCERKEGSNVLCDCVVNPEQASTFRILFRILLDRT